MARVGKNVVNQRRLFAGVILYSDRKQEEEIEKIGFVFLDKEPKQYSGSLQREVKIEEEKMQFLSRYWGRFTWCLQAVNQ